MKKTTLAMTAIFVIFLSNSISAAELVVLPFRVSGNAYPKEEMPVLLQEAFVFLFRAEKDFNVQRVSETRSALRELSIGPNDKIDSIRSNQICSTSQGSHLFAGEAHFSSKSQVILKGVVYSCQTKSVIAKVAKSGDFAHIQRLFRKTIDESFPFARDKPTPIKQTSEAQDILVILDTSGSMFRDISSIVETLSGLRDNVASGSRLGVIVVGKDSKREVFPFSADWNKNLQLLRSVKVEGEVTWNNIEAALGTVDSFRDWRGKRKLLLFSDAQFQGKRNRALEERLRKIRTKDIDIYLFSLLSQEQSDRLEYERLSRMLDIPDPSIIYGRRVGFLQGYSVFFIMNGARMYRADQDVSAMISSGQISLEDLIPLQTISYKSEDLNLDRFPEKYAEVQNLKVVGMDRILSSLPRKIYSAVKEGPAASPEKILVKNASKSFWVYPGSRNLIRLLRPNDTKYLGLQIQVQGIDPIPLLPAEEYIVEQSEVPRLFVTTWEEWQKRSSKEKNPEDVWFFLSEVLEIKGGTGDIRE